MIGAFIQDFEKEGFADPPSASSSAGRQSNISITTCPAGSSSYITAAGNTNCCEGDLVNNICNGNDICSLSPSIPGGLQSCADWITKEWIKRGQRYCSRFLPYYYGTLSRIPGTEGCSASLCSPDGSNPQDVTQPRCKIYGNNTDELTKVDSCYNINARDSMVCPQADAKKLIVSYSSILPAILKCNYIPTNGSSNGMPVDCMDADRAIQYINMQGGPYKDTIINNISSGKDVQFCNASKAYYVDRSLTTGVKSVPGQTCPTTTTAATAATAASAANAAANAASAASAAATAATATAKSPTRFQMAKDAVSNTASAAASKLMNTKVGGAVANTASAAASKIGNLFRR